MIFVTEGEKQQQLDKNKDDNRYNQRPVVAGSLCQEMSVVWQLIHQQTTFIFQYPIHH